MGGAEGMVRRCAVWSARCAKECVRWRRFLLQAAAAAGEAGGGGREAREATVATAGAARRTEVRRPTNEVMSWGVILIHVFGATARAAN